LIAALGEFTQTYLVVFFPFPITWYQLAVVKSSRMVVQNHAWPRMALIDTIDVSTIDVLFV
jgi:hypothetical protein